MLLLTHTELLTHVHCLPKQLGVLLTTTLCLLLYSARNLAQWYSQVALCGTQVQFD